MRTTSIIGECFLLKPRMRSFLLSQDAMLVLLRFWNDYTGTGTIFLV